MPRSSRRHIDGAAVALAIYVAICCGIPVCLALGLYELMQPMRTSNPGLAAYKPPPGTVIDFATPTRPLSVPETLPVVIEPTVETIAEPAPQQQVETKKSTSASKTQRTKRQRAARRKERRDPMTGFAFQPSFGGYRSWY